MLTMKKMTLLEAHNGICGSKNNCYFKGNSIVWCIMDGEDIVTECKRKKDAVRVVEEFNRYGITFDNCDRLSEVDKEIMMLTDF